MLKEIKTSLLLFLVMLVITGGIYPLVITSAAHVVFPNQANGSLLEKEGKIIGSGLIGQQFNKLGFFLGRPSSAGSGYDAMKSGASNLSPTNAKLQTDIATRYAEIVTLYNDKQVPTDLLTASASGLDPHISVSSAMYQVPKIVKVHKVGEAEVISLVEKNTETSLFGIFGQPRVNVLKLNMDIQELDARNIKESNSKKQTQGKIKTGE